MSGGRVLGSALLGAQVQLGARSFRLRSVVSSGDVAHVFVARHDDGSEAAVKVLRPELHSDAYATERFEREAVCTERSQHAHVIALTQPLTSFSGFRYFGLELLRGIDLAQLLQSQQRLAPARALRVARSLAEALGAVHRAGVLHRDLKPENVFLQHLPDGREHAKLIDFGAAILVDSPPANLRHRMATAEGRASWTSEGTPAYMAPERLHGEAVVGSDLFSLGALLYEMLAGYAPSIQNLDITGVVAPAREIVRHCLRDSTTERYQSADRLCQDLDEALAALASS